MFTNPNDLTEKQRLYDNYYLDIAERSMEMSYAIRRKVGCVIVRDGRILSDGWNGMPPGMDNACETGLDGEYIPLSILRMMLDHDTKYLKTKPEVLHAETNAIAKLCRHGDSSEGATAYVTIPPCIECAKLLHRAGIVRIVFRSEYVSTKPGGVEYLHERHVEIVNYSTGA